MCYELQKLPKIATLEPQKANSFLVPCIIWLFNTFDHEKIRANIIIDEPIMTEVFQLEPSSGGCDWDQCHILILSGIIIYASLTVIFIIAIPALLYNYIKEIKLVTSKHRLSSNTINIFNMLTKVILIQLGMVFGSLVIPFIFGEIMFFTHDRNGSLYAQFIFFPVGTHTVLECLSLVILIKPYRRFVMKILKCIFHLKKFPSEVNTMTAYNVTVYNVNTRIK